MTDERLKEIAASVQHMRGGKWLVNELLTEISRLRAGLCPHCECTLFHPGYGNGQSCQCENDE